MLSFVNGNIQLIQLYIYVCECYDRHLSLHFTRLSNNYLPEFTDQELITVKGRKDFPLLFDQNYQSKKVFWEVVKF